MANQSQTTKTYLIEALERLLQKESFDEISITELTKVAGISRMTFYRHYQNINDILVEAMQDLVTGLTAQLDFKTIVQHEGLVFMMQYLRSHTDFIKILVRAQQQDMLRENIARVLADMTAHKKHIKNLSAREMSYYVRYHSTGLTSVVIDWVTKKQPETAEELATFLEKIGEGGSSN